MQPDLRSPCVEAWDQMRVGCFGRHCLKCDKVVVDFTAMTKQELVRHLSEHPPGSVCGRVRPDQIDRYHDLAEIYIQRSLKFNRSSNLAFYLLAIAAMTAASCGGPGIPDQLVGHDNVDPAQGDTLDRLSNTDKGVNGSSEEQRKDGPTSDIAFVGELIIDGNGQYSDPVDPMKCGMPDSLPEVMAEFPGGQDSLYAFLRRNLNYPEWESENNIEGKLYVEFVVGKDGVINSPKVVRGIRGSRNFDAEVLRVVSLMPNWVAARYNDEAISSRLVLPIKFIL